MRYVHLSGALVLVGLTGFGGCNDPELLAELKALGEGCLLDSDCEADLVCVFRKCHYECVETKDCLSKPAAPPGVRCVKGDKPTNVCLLEAELPCGLEVGGQTVLDDSQCPGDLVCGPDAECRDGCATSNQCVAGQLCVQGTCADADELNGSGLLTDPAESGEGTPCTYNSDCAQPLVCKAGVCLEACKQDVDCPEGQTCVEEPASGKRVCKKPVPSGTPEHCGDGALSGDETGADCGGSCPGCPAGEPCAAAGDCASGACDGGVCQVATCADGIKNQTETGVDCGGASCPPCPACAVDGDCPPDASCVGGACVADHCKDGVLSGDETSADCGGSCAGCDAGDACGVGGDCLSLSCQAGLCAQPSCADGVQNGAETGADCGGPCAACGVGGGCVVPGDCATGACAQGVCALPSCSDGAQNGFETGVDCGGTCAGCASGEACVDDGDCGAGLACDPAALTCKGLFTLTVTKAGTGDGVVSSTAPAGLVDCGATCSAVVLEGTSVTLVAAPQAATFDGFTGACVDPLACVLVAGGDLDVTATFTATGAGQPIWAVGDLGAPRGVAVDGQGAVLVSGGLIVTGGWGGPPLVPVSGTDLAVAKLVPNGTSTPTHVWSKNWGNAAQPLADYIGQRVAVDAQGDVFVAVSTENDLRMNAATLLDCPAAANGLAVVKLDGATGDFVVGACFGPGVTVKDALVDGNGDFVVVGDYTGTLQLGALPALPAAAGTDAFVARFGGATLAPLAAARLGDGNVNAAGSAVVAPNGDLYVAATCGASVAWGGSAGATTGLGGSDLCAVRLSPALSALAAHQNGGPGADTGAALGRLPDGRVVLGGSFSGSNVDFGDGVGRTAGASTDLVLLELDGASLALVQQANKSASIAEYGDDTKAETLVALAVHGDGSIALTGKYGGAGTLSFGGAPLGSGEIFVVKLSSWKAFAWSRTYASGNVDFVWDLTTVPGGGPVVLAGNGGSGASWGAPLGAIWQEAVVGFAP